MVKFTALIKRFDKQGEKTGWTYLEIPQEIASELQPGNRKTFRVKGRLDAHAFEKAALLPMRGEGFIMPLNATLRKCIKKGKGDTVAVVLEVDYSSMPISPDLLQCLSDEPAALQFFTTLPVSQQRYFSNWIDSGKTIETKTKRISHAVLACARKQPFGEMMRSIKIDSHFLNNS